MTIKCIGTEKTTTTQITPYQLLSILNTFNCVYKFTIFSETVVCNSIVFLGTSTTVKADASMSKYV